MKSSVLIIAITVFALFLFGCLGGTNTSGYSVSDSQFCGSLSLDFNRDDIANPLSGEPSVIVDPQFISSNKLSCSLGGCFVTASSFGEKETGRPYIVGYCRRGSNTGENVNGWYCISKKTIADMRMDSTFEKTLLASDGTILGKETYGLDSAIFNQNGEIQSCSVRHA